MPKITGTIFAEGEPLGGAYVRLIGPSGAFVAEIYTREDGAFTFHVGDGSWNVEVRAAQRTSVSRAVTVDSTDQSVAIEV